MQKLIITKITQGTKKILSNKYVVIGIIVFITLFILRGGIRKIITRIREKKFNKNETKNVNQIAQQYRAASNPSGANWMINWDGTHEDQIEKLAYQTKGYLKPIADAYKLKFQETLTDRMRKELDAEDFQNWYNIVS